MGNYSVTFDASGLTSGVYFYKLIVGDPETSLPAGKAGSGQGFIETKKMILIR